MVPYNELFETGLGFDDFIQTGLPAERSAAHHFAHRIRLPGALPAATQQRVAAIKGTYSLLIAGEIWCPDCQINVAALDYLCEVQPAITLKIISRGRAQNNLQAELGLDAVPIPLVLVLDHRFELVGRFVERPQVVIRDAGAQVLSEYKAGHHMQDTVMDVLAVIEACEQRSA